MISKDQVIHIAKLARLELSEKEIEKIQKDLSSILDYFKLLQNQKSKIKDQKYSSKIKNVLREDKVVEKSPSLANNLVQMAPEKKEGYIKVKSIF